MGLASAAEVQSVKRRRMISPWGRMDPREFQRLAIDLAG